MNIKHLFNVIDSIEHKIGTKNFKKIFGVILADRGSEFIKHDLIEKSINEGLRCKIFYCDPGKPRQKSHIENAHKILRYYIRKSIPLTNYTQDDCDFMASNINSLYKEKYKNTPYDKFLSLEKTYLIS